MFLQSARLKTEETEKKTYIEKSVRENLTDNVRFPFSMLF